MKFKLFDLTFNSEVDLASQKKIASNSTDVRIFFSKSYLPANYKSKNFEINEGNGFYFRKKVQNGVTGVTGLETLIQLQKKVTLWCNLGVTRCNQSQRA